MIKAIIFDADGVLINTEKFSRQLSRDYGIAYERLDPFFENEFQRCLVGKADLKESITPYLVRWGWKGTVDELLNYWFKVEHKIDEPLIDYISTLKAKGLKCFVATNQEKYRAQYMLTEMGFGDVFDRVFASAHLGHKKPVTSFFARLHEELDSYEKSEVLFWDDEPANVEGAKAYGFSAEIYEGFDAFKLTMQRYLNN